MNKKIISFIMVILMAIVPITDTYGATKTRKKTVKPTKKILTVKDIAKKNTSVLLLKVYDALNNEISTASGFIVNNDGRVVTNYHVIDKASSIKAIAYNKKEYTVTGVLGYNVAQDIALLYIKDLKGLPALTMGDSSKVELADQVVAIGSPLGLQNTVSVGIISGLRSNIVRTAKGVTDFQISAPISHGSSGGVLFDMYGQVIGITYAGENSGQNINYAIPINEIKPLLKSNTYLNLQQLMYEVYNQYETDNFSTYLFQKYCIYFGDKSLIEVDQIDVSPFENEPESMSVNLIMHTDKYNKYMANYDFDDIYKWMNLVCNEVINKYPNRKIYGYLMLYDNYKEKPNQYSENEISYKENEKRWYVDKRFVGYYYNNKSTFTIECTSDRKLYGRGVLVTTKGDMFCGKFIDGKMDGKGTLYLVNGDMYVGEFSDGKLNGFGVYTYANGSQKTGNWNNNIYIGN